MNDTGEQRRLAAILFADVVGYSRMMAADESATLARLKAVRDEIFDPKTAEYRGRLVKLIGDGTLLEFSSVVDALRFAIALQQSLAERNAEIPADAQITFRIAINIGDVMVEGDDLYGDGVNVAARLEKLAEPGGICISQSVHEQLAGKLDLAFEDLGAQQIKNIPRPIRVFRVHWDGRKPSLARKNKRHSFLWPALAIVLILLVTLAALVLWWLSPPSEDRTAAAVEETPALAVLPFNNLSPDRDEDHFADGLTIEIIEMLGKTGGFRIPGFTSAFQYKDDSKDLKAIGKALNVDFLLEGSIQRKGDSLDIKVNLVRAQDGFLIWSMSFSETMETVFQAQVKIARAIGNALATPMEVDAEILKAQRTADPKAYELFLRGLALLERRGAALKEAMGTLERAVAIHTDFAAAWAALSLVYNVVPTYLTEIDGRRVRARVFYRKAKDAALEAEGIDPSLPIVQQALGSMYQRDRQWAAAERAYKAALAGDRDNHGVMMSYAALLQTVGKQQEALVYLKTAQALDPLNAHYDLWLAFLRWQFDQSEEHIRTIETIFQRVPQFRQLALRIIIDHRAAQNELGQVKALVEACSDCSEALRSRALTLLAATDTEAPQTYFEAHKRDTLVGYQLLYHLGGAVVTLEAFDYTSLVAERRLLYFTVPWSLVVELGDEAEFLEILDDLGLLAYWSAHGPPDHCAEIEAVSCGE